ncbi:uncharacterized protein LY89DRAFT_671041 [Mollisia scopiformis]|uniref:Uncharacterized protein n=1 Tax=Mollisia scopiformis TaxID=149040 RepID=A0A194X5X6_MOLSC|nr:uncharacterized protein LY89DRAFT_671041 [Mollisia scopiformis]KUJ15588.1 hypothetical protein LY89DRAFT_671041 [Mollisia scopiformis]
MLVLAIYTLCVAASGRAVAQQIPLLPGSASGLRDVPGDSIVKLCNESNEEIDVFIWGNSTRNLSRNSTVDYQINATANTGDFGTLRGTFNICDYLEKMHQPPNSSVPEKACPPREGPIYIDYAFWFADFLVAPGQWSIKFDAKTPEGDRIYCLETEFDLQCPSEHDGPECLRDVSDTPSPGAIILV